MTYTNLYQLLKNIQKENDMNIYHLDTMQSLEDVGFDLEREDVEFIVPFVENVFIENHHGKHRFDKCDDKYTLCECLSRVMEDCFPDKKVSEVKELETFWRKWETIVDAYC